MSEEQQKELDAIRLLAQRLLNKIDALAIDPETVHEPPDAVAKMSQRICLGCGITVPEGEPYRRGLHDACYHTTMRRIRDGDWSEPERIAVGKLGKKGRAGRTAAIDATTAAEAIAQQIADKIAPRKVAEPKQTYKKPKGSK